MKNMKKKKWLAAAMMLVLVFFAACDIPDEAIAVTSDMEEMEAQIFVPEIMGGQAEEAEADYIHAEPVEIVVYYSNGRADGLEKEVLEVNGMTPEEIIQILSRHNIVSIDTKVLGFTEREADGQGKRVLELDLSKAFGEYLRTMGADGEEVILAALTNTFLENYRADGLLLTVDGGRLETGHGIYTEELVYKKLEAKSQSGD